jgi:RNA polymerase sigma-70 factor (ECF subfamily)
MDVSPSPLRPPGHDSFEVFYRAQADRVYRALAITLGDPHLAREATDEAMVRAFARWSRVQSLQSPGGWVYRVGLNWATSWWRKLRREQPMPAGHDFPATSDTQAVAALAAIRELPVAQRTVVVCRVLLDLSTADSAELLGVAPGTVKSRLARALTALRAALNEKEESDANI